MFKKLRAGVDILAKTLRLMIGIPDYQVYCEHQQKHHPDRTVMTPEEFFRNSQARRYDSSRAGRCC